MLDQAKNLAEALYLHADEHGHFGIVFGDTEAATTKVHEAQVTL